MNIGAGIGVGFQEQHSKAFRYSGSEACQNGSDVTPIIKIPGGTFSSSPAGLSINSSTGVIDVSASTVGSYTITYSIGPTIDTMNIVAADDSSFSYSASSFRQNASNPAPTIIGISGGTFSAPTGIIFADSGTNTNSSSGIINLATSTIGGPYTITYTSPGPCPTSSTFDVTVLVTLSIAYSAAAFCEDGGNTAAPTVVGDSGSGTFAANPAGLTINSSSGVINTDTSVPGDGNPYTVTYTASTGETATTQVTIKNLDNATFTYSSTSFCENASNQTPSITSPGGTFTSQDISFRPLKLQFSVTSGVQKTISLGITGTNYTIDWGDGTVETNQSGAVSHIYNSGGFGTTTNPTISIGAASDSGPVTDFTINSSNRADLIDIISWGSLVYTGSWSYKFIQTNNLVSPITAIDYPNISNVSNFFGAFMQSSINVGISNWVFNFTSSFVNFGRMFYIATSFNEDISSWDVSAVSKFNDMFRSASSFSKNLSNWYVNGLNPNLSSVNNMAYMFWNSAMTSEHFTDTIVGFAVAVHRDSGPYSVNASTLSPSSFDATRTQDTDNSGNTVDYSTKYGYDWPSNPSGENWTNAGDARQFLLNNGWSVS